ncbi:hypothetical protein tb265_18720 [Gemmatimonadetes bacterium T265]|nr:hypothetical protein tb265_18720 [Gemmatimonadetes bacterium T265]
MTDNARSSSSVPPESAPDWATLARLTANEPAADAEARARDDAARAWLAAHPAEAARLAVLGRALTGVTVETAAVPPVDVEAALARVRAAAGLDRQAPAATPAAPQLTVIRGGAPRPRDGEPSRAVTSRTVLEPSRARGWRRVTGLVAATALLTAGVTWWRTGGLAGRTVLGPTVASTGGTVTAQRYATAVGERQLLHLADGSQVVLGPASLLDVPAGYGGTARRVHLTGEAYFRAVHDPRRPFEVAAGDAVVRDIGTAFVVRAPAASAQPGGARPVVDVSVTTGAVQLRAADSAGSGSSPAAGVLLHAGDRGRVVARTGSSAPAVTVVVRGADIAADTAWTTGRLVFRDTPLRDVAGALRRWYGVELRFADSSVAGRHLTATFAGESTDAVLRVVGLATGARLERRGDTVVVREATPSP